MLTTVMNYFPSEPRGTVARSKNETKEEKRSRKQAVKEERQVHLLLSSISTHLTCLMILDSPNRKESNEGDVLCRAQAATATARGKTNTSAQIMR